MSVAATLSVLRMLRLDTSLLAFLSVFVPLYYSNKNPALAAAQASPIFSIFMAGFIINDLHDVERDRENHPSRALPSGHITPVFAGLIYFFLVGISLVLVRTFEDVSAAFLCVLLLLCLINYNYVVSYLPVAKSIYAAAGATLPLVILSALVTKGWPNLIVLASLFLIMNGRELLMDLVDAKGDGLTLGKRLGPINGEIVAFALVLSGISCLFIAAKTPFGFYLAIAFLLFDILIVGVWRFRYFRTTIFLLKAQLLMGIYYLL